MAISVKDIQEKEFSTQAADGYNVEQVDDFLDELAEQLGSMVRESLALTNQVKQLESELAAVKAEKADMEKKLPDYNENGYFRNLESAMRESLIGAQRIADETITEAKKKAQQTVADANAQAEKTIADATEQAEAATARAEKAVSELKAEEERLHAVVDAYRNNFQKLLDEQLEALTASEALLTYGYSRHFQAAFRRWS